MDNFKHFKIFILKLSNAKSFKIVHPYDFKIVLPFYWSAFKIVILKSSSFPQKVAKYDPNLEAMTFLKTGILMGICQKTYFQTI